MSLSYPLRLLIPRIWRVYPPVRQARLLPRWGCCLLSTLRTRFDIKPHPNSFSASFSTSFSTSFLYSTSASSSYSTSQLSSTSHFRHTTLPPRHIRVLKIHNHPSDPTLPPSTSVTATCTQISLDASPRPHYVALSYCWGDPTLTHEITLNGLPYRITANLHEFMLLIARSDVDYTFWIDAVCIQQTDLRERGEQVAVMGEVYSKAEFVVAWLGGEGEDSGLAFDFAEAAAAREERDIERVRREGEGGVKGKSVGGDGVRVGDGLVGQVSTGDVVTGEGNGDIRTEPPLPPLTFLGISAFQVLMRRPWFSRIWVVQEVVLARSAVLMCGERVLGWQTLAAGVSLFSDSEEYLDEGIEAVRDEAAGRDFDPSMGHGWSLISSVRACRARRNMGTNLELSTVLCFFMDNHSSDPRDMVYGLLGIIDKAVQTAIRPDYTMGVPELYAKAALTCIEIDKSLQILSVSGIGHNRSDLDLPSWAPDYVQKPSAIYDPRWGYSGGTTQVKHRSVDLTKLYLSGFQVDAVDRLGPIWNRDSVSTSAPWQWYLDVEAAFLLLGVNDEAFWRTLCKDRATSFSDAPSTDGMQPHHEAYKVLNRSTDGRLGTTSVRIRAKRETPELYAKANEFTRLLWATCMGRRMGMTKGGRLGMFPPKTRAGDVVFVALGGHDPLLIREVEEAREVIREGQEEISEIGQVQQGRNDEKAKDDIEYHFVGTCYVHTIMDGEALDMGLQEEEVLLV